MKEVQTNANIDRVHSTHVCLMEGVTAEVTPLGGESNDEMITMIDKAKMLEMDLEMFNYYKLSAIGENKTHLLCRLAPAEGHEFNEEMSKFLVESRRTDLISFKEFCEMELNKAKPN